MSDMDRSGETLPVLAEDLEILAASDAELQTQRRPAGGLPAVQAAAAAAGGFVAGAAVVGLVGRRQRRSRALEKAAPRRRLLRRAGGARGSTAPAELLQIVGSRSLLLDVHLLGGSGADR
jgi:hypothetical protein